MIAGRSAARRGIRAKHSALRKEHEHKKKVQLEQAKIWFQQHVSGNWNPAHHRAAAKLELLRLALRRFDTDKSGVLSRDQLAKLLEHVAAVPPSEEALDTAMEAAKHVDTTGDGQPDTMGISKKAATMVVTKYVVRASETLRPSVPVFPRRLTSLRHPFPAHRRTWRSRRCSTRSSTPTTPTRAGSSSPASCGSC